MPGSLVIPALEAFAHGLLGFLASISTLFWVCGQATPGLNAEKWHTKLSDRAGKGLAVLTRLHGER